MKSSSFAPLAFAASLVAVVHAHKGTDVHDDQFLFRQSLHSCHKESPCVLSPEVMEGPYYIPDGVIRSNIKEDREGVPFTLDIQVIDVETCEPLACYVDLWTADWEGHYSGFLDSMIEVPGKRPGGPGGPRGPHGPAGPGGPPRPRPTTPGPGSHIPTDNSTFLRGVLPTDHEGTARFELLYPGWYPGRAVHLHLKVHHDTSARNTSSHTGQLFLPQDLNDLLSTMYPYNQSTQHRVLNEDDGLFKRSGEFGLIRDVEWVKGGKTLFARAVVGVNGSAVYDERIM